MQIFYYPRTIRSVIVSLSQVFTNILCYNFDSISGDTSAAIQRIPVPVKFGPQDKKFLSRTEEESGQRYQVQLPEISIELKSIQYSEKRATGTNEYRFFTDPNTPFHDLNSFFEDTQPAPYDFSFNLRIRTNSLDHSFQIFEQILPIFNPTITLRIKEFKFLNISRELKVRLDSTSLEFQEPMTQDDRREIISTIPIVVEAVLYKPTSTSKIIKEIIYKQYINSHDTSGSSSSYNKLVEMYSTSGYEGMSVSAFPHQYSTSAFDPINNVYFFTSASSYF